MREHYKIFKRIPKTQVIEEVGNVYSYEEIMPTVENLKLNTPEYEFFYQIVKTSAVRPGFGRDPELH